MGLPLFTIVMPTRNRAELLRNSIRTALAQNFDDFEVLVSANNCSDDTIAVAQSTGDARVRVVNPGKTLSMPDHWDYALTHVRGRFVTCLSDDDAIAPNLLSTLYDLIQKESARVIVWSGGAYYYPDSQLVEKRRRVEYPIVSGTIVRLPTDRLQREQYDLARAPYVPRFLNSCNLTSVAHSIQREVGHAFVGSCPDYSYPAFLLARESEVFFIDRPLLLSGWSSKSIGASSWYDMGPASQEFHREFENYEHFQHVPLKTVVTTNYIADSLEAARSLDTAHSFPPLNLTQYYRIIWSELQTLKARGAITEAAEGQFRAAVSNLDPEQQREVEIAVEPNDQFRGAFVPSTTPPSPARFKRLRQTLRTLIDSSAATRRLERSLRGPRISEVLADFEQRRFDTIVEAILAVHEANLSLGWR